MAESFVDCKYNHNIACGSFVINYFFISLVQIWYDVKDLPLQRRLEYLRSLGLDHLDAKFMEYAKGKNFDKYIKKKQKSFFKTLIG